MKIWAIAAAAVAVFAGGWFAGRAGDGRWVVTSPQHGPACLVDGRTGEVWLIDPQALTRTEVLPAFDSRKPSSPVR